MAYIQDWGMRVQAQPQINTTRRAFLHLSQNENGRMLNIRITDVNIPSGSTAVLAGTKPDGTVYSQAGTLAGNTATFAEDVQMTAVVGTWDAKITVTNGGNCICTARITITIDPDTVAGRAVPSDSQLDGIIAECRAIADSVRKEAYGSPLVAGAVEDMTDQSRVYVYTGSESGMTAGHWYYYNGSAWSDGGVYNAVAVDTDTTLSIAGKAADAKEVGDQLTSVKEELEDIIATAYVTDSANGSVAHFTDGADNIPMKSVRIDTDATSGKVTRCGKNWLKLISESGYPTEKYGIVLTLNDDGSWTLRGTSTRAITHTLANKNSFSLKAGRYKLSGGISDDVIVRINAKDVVYTSKGSDVEFEYADGDFDGASAWGNVYVRVEANVTLDTTIYPMIRLASESDSYEPYKGDTYDVTITDGVVQEEITSLLGINNVWSDSGDIECEYRADTKLYIDKRLGV